MSTQAFDKVVRQMHLHGTDDERRLFDAGRRSGEHERARLRGHLASIVADPDCCAVSKQIARVAIADDPAEPISEASFDRTCPATFGREAVEHSWVTVTRSTTRPPPYRMCSKCRLTAQVGRNPKGEDLQGLRAEHEHAVGEADAPTLSAASPEASPRPDGTGNKPSEQERT